MSVKAGKFLINPIVVGALVVVVAAAATGTAVVIKNMQSNKAAEESAAVVLEPDYDTLELDEAAEIIPDDTSEKAEVAQGGGSVTISFSDSVEYSLSSGELSLYYQNPNASTHNVVVQVILEHGDDEYLLAQSGILEPGYQVTSLDASADAPRLSEGGYNGKLKLLFYDPETGERAIVDTDIPCTVNVVG